MKRNQAASLPDPGGSSNQFFYEQKVKKAEGKVKRIHVFFFPYFVIHGYKLSW